MAESVPEHLVEYLLLREHLKKYARDLLDECGNSPEVEELLEDTGGSDQGRRNSLFDEALCKEPLRLDTSGDKKLKKKKVFILGEHANILAESFPEHLVEYFLLREHLKKYARDLLDECSNTAEVEELLEDTGGNGHGRRDSLFDEALRKEQKPFVSHA